VDELSTHLGSSKVSGKLSLFVIFKIFLYKDIILPGKKVEVLVALWMSA